MKRFSSFLLIPMLIVSLIADMGLPSHAKTGDDISYVSDKVLSVTDTKNVSKSDDIKDSAYVKGQVVVRYRPSALRVSKNDKKSLKKALSRVRSDRHVDSAFGSYMKASGDDGSMATTVREQKKLLSGAIGEDYTIEDSVSFGNGEGEYIISLISSKTLDTKSMTDKLSQVSGIESVYANAITESTGADFDLDDPYIEQCFQLGDDSSKDIRTDKKLYHHGANSEQTKDASIGATDLWDVASEHKISDKNVVIAVLDTGVDYTHEELKDNMWVNPGDIGLVGKYGYDFDDVDEDPMDTDGHGTHCAGIIAAAADNAKGISGVTGKFADDGRVQIMALRVIEGRGTSFEIFGAYRYVLSAVENGVNVRAINNSWGYVNSDDDEMYHDIYEELGKVGVLNIFSAGNDNTDIDKNVDAPATGTSDYVLSVGALDNAGKKSGYSNYGKSNVDIFAPGTSITSSVSYDNYFTGLYDKEQIEKTSRVFGQFSKSVTPDTAGADTEAFDTPVVLDKNGEPIEDGVTLSVTDERAYNTRTKKSLKVEIDKSKSGEDYYVVFPYRKLSSDTGKGTYADMTVIRRHDDTSEFGSGKFCMGDIVSYKDHSGITMAGSETYTYAATHDYITANMKTSELLSASVMDSDKAFVTGLGLKYHAQTGGRVILYIDSLGIAKKDVSSSAYGQYDVMSGTSMSCPTVVGAAALLCILRPDLTEDTNPSDEASDGALRLKASLMASVTKTDKLKDKCSTGGYLDLSKVAQKTLCPAISYIETDFDKKTVTLYGIGFSNTGAICVTDLISDKVSAISSDDILSRNDGEIVIDATAVDLIGKYLEFSVTADNGRNGTASFYTAKGKLKFDEIGYYSISTLRGMWEDPDKEGKNFYPVSDGSNLYLVADNGTIKVYDPDMLTFVTLSDTPIDDMINSDKLFDKLDDSDFYENSQYADISVIGAPVYIGGVMYEWISLKASDRVYYIGVSYDISYEAESDNLYNALGNDTDDDDEIYDVFDQMDDAKFEAFMAVKSPDKTGEVMPENLLYSGVSMASYMGKVYLLGGRDKEGELSKEVRVFDPDTKKWSRDVDLPEGIENVKLYESHGALYAFLADGGSDVSDKIYRYDGNRWTLMSTRFPKLIRARTSARGIASADPVVGLTKDGLIISGYSADGYGDTFIMNTTSASDVSFTDTGYTWYDGINTYEDKLGGIIPVKVKNSVQDHLYIISNAHLDSTRAYLVSHAGVRGSESGYEDITKKTSGNATGLILGPERIPTGSIQKIRYSTYKVDGATLEWVKVGKKKVKVNADGTFTAQIKGATTIEAHFTKPIPVKKIRFKKKIKRLRAGKKFKCKIVFKPKDATVKKVTYKSSKKKYASVSKKGVIKAKKAGIGHKVKITAKTPNGKKATMRIKIIKRKKR